MVKTEAKRVLALAIADGRQEAVDHGLRKVPWVMRGMVSRKIHKTISAILLDNTTHNPAFDHIFRLAWLELSRNDVTDPTDVHGVSTLYAEKNPGETKQSPWIRYANHLAVFGFVGITLAVSIWFLVQKRPPLETPEGMALGTLLPEYVIAVNGWADAKRNERIVQTTDLRQKVDSSRNALIHADGLPEPVRSALNELFDTKEQLLIAADYSHQDTFHEALRGLNRQLLHHQLPYFIDAEIIDQSHNDRLVILSTYHVLEKRTATANNKTVLALHVNRLDNLNFRQDYLGFTRPHIEVALVLHDNLEDIVVNFVAPALGDGRPMPLIDMESREFDSPWQDQLLQHAGAIVRSELNVSKDAESVQKLGKLFADRYELVRRWQVELERKGVILPDPEKYNVTDTWLESVEQILPNMEVVQLRDIERALADESLRTTFDEMMAPLISSVERHEVQHRLDYEHKKEGLIPPAVRTLYGIENPEDEPSPNAKRVATELSAYVAELAYDAQTTYLNLTLLSRLLFQKTMWGTAESQVALIVFQNLPERLGLDPPGALTYRGRVDREKLSKIYFNMLDVDRDKIRKAARTFWEEQYGRTLPDQITSTESL